MSGEPEVIFTARLIAERRVHVVSEESAQQLAQAFLDVVAEFGRVDVEEALAKAALRRKARAER